MPRVYQHTLHPDPGKLDRIYGIRGPSRNRATLDPLTKIPEARPLRLAANQAEAKAIRGTFEPALPAPVSKRIARANSKESESPVRIRLTATTLKKWKSPLASRCAWLSSHPTGKIPSNRQNSPCQSSPSGHR